MGTETKKTIIIIGGPTASGKTALAIEVAKFLKTSIISADSRQIYKNMAVGTAQPTNEEMHEVKHHLIAALLPDEHFTAADFVKSCINILESDILNNNNFAVITGGTGLYLKALLEGLDEIPDIPAEIRNQVSMELEEKGLEWLQREVKNIDEAYFNSIDHLNPRRLTRALEVFRTTNRPISHFLRQNKGNEFTDRYNVFSFWLNPNREVLYQRINERVLEMVKNGLETEVENLMDYKNYKSLQTVGYSEFFDYFDGKTTREQAINLIQQHTRNYAKRQITWFKNQQNWLALTPETAYLTIIKTIENA